MSDQALHYLDTSAVLAWLLEGSDELAVLEGSRSVASSRLLWTDVARASHSRFSTHF